MDELSAFLEHERQLVRNEAVKIVLGLTGDESNFPHFESSNFRPVKALMERINDDILTAHDALCALINLSPKVQFVQVMSEPKFLKQLVVLMMIPTNVNADLCCMLLNNLSKHDFVANNLLPTSESTDGVQMLDNLLEIFVRGDLDSFNPKAKFHFLSGVFANISASPQGCKHFLANSSIDGASRLSKLMVFTEHTDLIRRGGVIAAMKNVVFGCSLELKGFDILLNPALNLLVYVLLPLSGSEDFTMEEMEGMPDELQFLEPEKKRESDSKLRLMLLETLVAIGCTLEGRKLMRSIKVYPIVQKLHLQEKDETCSEEIEKLVNLLMRDEPEP